MCCFQNSFNTFALIFHLDGKTIIILQVSILSDCYLFSQSCPYCGHRQRARVERNQKVLKCLLDPEREPATRPEDRKADHRQQRAVASPHFPVGDTTGFHVTRHGKLLIGFSQFHSIVYQILLVALCQSWQLKLLEFWTYLNSLNTFYEEQELLLLDMLNKYFKTLKGYFNHLSP